MKNIVLIFYLFTFCISTIYAENTFSSLEIHFEICNKTIESLGYTNHNIYNLSIQNQNGTEFFKKRKIRTEKSIIIDSINYGKYTLLFDDLCENRTNIDFIIDSTSSTINICTDNKAIKDLSTPSSHIINGEKISILYIQAGCLTVNKIELIEIYSVNRKIEMKLFKPKKKFDLDDVNFKELDFRKKFKLNLKKNISELETITEFTKQLNLVNCISNCTSTDIFVFYVNDVFTYELKDSTCNQDLWKNLKNQYIK